MSQAVQRLKAVLTGINLSMGIYLIMTSVHYNHYFPLCLIPLFLGMGMNVSALWIWGAVEEG